ncbi:MAG: methyltransferase domain-containing protein [Opitutus sp.]|nr:methyltransferase domain-containing protein [Opitutus sp.]
MSAALRFFRWTRWLAPAVAFLGFGAPAPAAPDTTTSSSRYTTGTKTRDGIGKYYFGREIAHYMTHEGAPWLDRPERDAEERPDLVLQALGLKPGEIVADLGCGTGYFSWRLAQVVGPRGLVYGVEIQPEMLDLLAVKMKERNVSNVVGVRGTIEDPKLPQPVDLVLLVDVYHECSQPWEILHAVCERLKPGGRVVFVEYRAEDPTVLIKLLHKMTEAQVKLEMTALPLDYVETIRTLPRQHLIIFRKAAAR